MYNGPSRNSGPYHGSMIPLPFSFDPGFWTSCYRTGWSSPKKDASSYLKGPTPARDSHLERWNDIFLVYQSPPSGRLTKRCEVRPPKRTSYTLELNLTSNYLLYSSVESIKTVDGVFSGLLDTQFCSFLASKWDFFISAGRSSQSNGTRERHEIAWRLGKDITWQSRVTIMTFPLSTIKGL